MAPQCFAPARFALTVLAASLLAAATHAQTPADELLRQREQQRQALEAQRQAARPDALQAQRENEDRETLPGDESPCFAIQQVQLDGAQSFTFLGAHVDGIAGRCLGARGVQAVQRQLQRALVARGYVTTRVLVPEQNLAAGLLRLQVIPGRVAGIAHEGDAAGLVATALPTRNGLGERGLLNQRDLDQAVENLRRLPSQHTEIDIRPGDNIGESQLLFKHNSDKRWRLLTSLDNAGSKATGRTGASFTLGVDSPLYLYDQLTLTHNRNAQSADESGNKGTSLAWNVPFGYWSVSAGANRYEYLQTIAGFSGPIRYSGNSRGADLGLGWVAYRDASAKTSLAAKLIQRQSRSFIEDVEVEVQAKDAAAYELSLSQRQHVGDAVADATLGARGGLASQSPKPGVIVGAPDYKGSYSVLFANASLTVPLRVADVPLRYQGQLKLQKSQSVAPPSEFFSIGNRYSVRGFSGERSLAAEHGAFVRNELAWETQLEQLGSTHVELYGALDAGTVRGANTQQLAGNTLAGGGLGVRGRWRGANVDLAVTAPIKQPALFGPRSTAVYVNAAYEF
jgi:hemolysin activation/secretion protein